MKYTYRCLYFIFTVPWGRSLLHNRGTDDVLDGLTKERSRLDEQSRSSVTTHIFDLVHTVHDATIHQIQQSYPAQAGSLRLEYRVRVAEDPSERAVNT